MAGIIIGIDEVGRGPLAGPVTVAALMMPKNLRIHRLTKGLKLKDSKKLSAQQRERWFQYINNLSNLSRINLPNKSRIFERDLRKNIREKFKKYIYATASVSPKVIDKINIAEAANLAATRALNKLMLKKNVKKAMVLLDGSLYVRYDKLVLKNKTRIKTKTIIKGDEKRNCIKLASIAAKVLRDRYMIRMDKKYPQYGFCRHKGYGTREHFKALRKHGYSQIHRLTFLRKYLSIK